MSGVMMSRSSRLARLALAGALAMNVPSLSASGQQTGAPPATAGAQAQPTAPTLADAQARLAANDAAGAIKILEGLTRSMGEDPRVWRMLGTASQTAGNSDRALDAWLKALSLQPNTPAALYGAAVAYAVKGDVDHALEYLSRTKATRQFDTSQFAVNPQLASVRGDARFKALLPTPDDFKNPFVEPVDVLNEWRGEATNDQFGWIARNIGDVDGDGVPDVATSAPTHASPGAAAGRIYVYSTRKNARLWTADGQAGDQLGIGIEGAGDTNKDGIPDVIAAAPGGGYAKVYSGRDGRVLLTLRAEDRGDAFGRHVSGVGDVNRDGHDDVIVGAPRNNAGGPGAGRAYVHSGKDGAVLLTLTGERAGDGFGSAVAGETHGGQLLIIVGAPSAGPAQRGRVYVHDSLASKPKFIVDADETGVALGAMFLATPGDVDGDGVRDVYSSDFPNSAKGPSTGRVYVHSGKDGRLIHALTGEGPGEGFGTSPSNAGDVNGDGYADLIVGAWQYGGGAFGAGRAYLYSGKDGSLMKTFTCRTLGDTFGFDSVTMGDINGDGMDDFLITSAWSAVNGFHSGRVFIVSSGVKRGV